MRKMINEYKVFLGKPDGRATLRQEQEASTRLDLK
jgi:hypothetical protein